MKKRPILVDAGNKSLVILNDGSIFESCNLVNSYNIPECEMCDLYFICEEELIASIRDILRKVHRSNINVFKFSDKLELNSLFLASYIRMNGYEM